MLIKDVLGAKASSQVITIEPEATVGDLVEALARHNVGALVVSHDGTTVAGIVSERDVVRGLAADAEVLGRTVADIMTATVASCTARDDVDSLMALMTERRIRHVPVLDGEQLIGVVSIGDVVKSRIGQLEFERDQLDSYVHQT